MTPWTLFAFVLAATRPLFVGASHDGLRARLQKAGIDAVYPGDPSYPKLSAAFNLRFTYLPAAIALPTSDKQVSEAVKAAVAEDIRITPRGGGHSYAAYGLGGENGHLVVDMQRMKTVAVDDGTGLATVETGIRLGDMALALYAQGKRALPHGVCSYVGVGGHAALGGYGFSARQWGLTLDNIVGHDVVLGNGTMVFASAHSNPDLFWALRGAGSSYGIITRYHFQTHPAPSEVTNFRYYWVLDSDASAEAFLKYQDFSLSPDVPSEIAFEINIAKAANTDDKLSLEFTGAYFGESSKFNAIVHPFLSKMPEPTKVGVKPFGWIDSLQDLAGSQPLSTRGQNLSAEHNTFYAKSITTPQNIKISDGAMSAFAKYMTTEGFKTSTDWFVQLEFWGGKSSKIMSVRQDATAYIHRDSLWTIQFYTSSSTGAPPFPDEGFTFLDGMVASITHNNSPDWHYMAYQNYVDDRLTPSEWENLYFGSHYALLEGTKRRYDPLDTFRFQQSIGEPISAKGHSKRSIAF